MPRGRLMFGPTFSAAIQTAAGNFQITDEGCVAVKKTVGQATTVTLPSKPSQGRLVIVKDAKGDAATNNVTVAGSGADTIDGAGTHVINVNFGAAIYEYNGTEWSILAYLTALASGSSVFNNVTLTGLLNESSADTLTAVGANQAAALALTKEVNRVTVGASTTGVALPPATAGLSIVVVNSVANSIHVYGTTPDTIDDVATATGIVQMQNSIAIYYCPVAGKWYSEGIGTGYSGGLMTLNFADSLTAVGTTQAGALALSNALNRVTTAAATSAPFNGVLLPASAGGLQIEIVNNAANPIQVYGAGTDTINGIATATGVSQGVGVIATYTCTTAGNWTVQFAQPQQASVLLLAGDGAIAPHTPHTYVITKGTAAALTLAAPTATTDDGLMITVTSNTAAAHAITATGLLQTGSASHNVATWAAQTGGSLVLMAYQGKWNVISQIGITFT